MAIVLIEFNVLDMEIGATGVAAAASIPKNVDESTTASTESKYLKLFKILFQEQFSINTSKDAFE